MSGKKTLETPLRNGFETFQERILWLLKKPGTDYDVEYGPVAGGQVTALIRGNDGRRLGFGCSNLVPEASTADLEGDALAYAIIDAWEWSQAYAAITHVDEEPITW